MRQRNLWSMAIAALAAALLGLTSGAPIGAVDEEAPVWYGTAPGTLVSTGATFGADRPSMIAGSEGRLLVSFNRLTTNTGAGTPDPYYVSSTDHGETWSTPAPIYVSPGVDSIQTSVAYGANMAHAVWIEDLQLVYARESDWPGISHVLAAPFTDPGALHPKILASGSNTLDVTWAEGAASSPAVRHARSTDGGANWTTNAVPPSPYNAEHPDLAIAANGQLHLVWEDSVLAEFRTYYSQGTPNGATVTWTNPIVISAGDTLARRPVIVLRGSTVQVLYTRRIANDQQWIMMASCDANCANASSWTAPLFASGQTVGVNSTDPTVLVASGVGLGVCSLIYFHGTQPSGAPPYNEDEVIMGVNSCDGWGGPRDFATEVGVRSLYPSLAYDDDHLHLAYERVDQGERQVFVRRADLPQVANPTIYLPFNTRR